MRSSPCRSAARRALIALVAAPLVSTTLLGANCGSTIPRRWVGNARLGPGCQFDTLSAAIAAAAPGDVLQVRASHHYTENLTVNKAIDLRGTTSSICVPLPPGPNDSRPTILPAIAGTTPVRITAAGSVTLADLVIRDGVGTDGGNIAIASASTVTLSHVDVVAGVAQRGGGIFAAGPLTITNDTRIVLNDATEGAGIYVDATSLVLGDAWIEDNVAETDGGGIHAESATVTEEPGATSIVLYQNTALRNGAGIYVNGGSMDLAVTLAESNVAYEFGGGLAVGLDAPTLLRIGPLHHNTATLRGGGFYAVDVTISGLGDVTENHSQVGGGGYLGDGTLTAAARFHDNSAVYEGGGIYLSSSRWAGSGTLEYNSADTGGGAWLLESTIDWSASPDTPTIRFNDASTSGGGVYLGLASSVQIAQGEVTDNSAGSGGGFYVAGSSGGTSLELSAATTLERNHAAGNGGGIAAIGEAELLLKEIKARFNDADGSGGAVAALAHVTGVPSITVLNRDDGLPDCEHEPFTPGFDEYCVEFMGNTAGVDGGALFLESAIGSVEHSGFLANDAAGRGDAIVLGGTAGSANLVLENSVLADHATTSEVVWVADGSRLTAVHVTAADNFGAPLRWSAGSSGALRNSAIADVPIAIDAGVALGGDCNSLFTKPPATGGTLAGVVDAGLTAASFFTDPVRGRFQVTAGLALLDDLCANGAAFDVDGAPRDATADRGAFEER